MAVAVSVAGVAEHVASGDMFSWPSRPTVAAGHESEAAQMRRLWPRPSVLTWPLVTQRRMVRSDTPATLAASGTVSNSDTSEFQRIA